MIIVVYNTLDGDIIKCATCPDGMEDIQCGPNEAWIEHEWVDDSLYKVDLNTLDIIPIE